MNPTKEQLSILESAQNMQNGDVLLVNALAGCAKTTTLKMITENNPNSKFLYLAFNRSVVEEAKATFPTNTAVLTISGFARRYVNSNNEPNGNIFDFISEALNITNWQKWDIKYLYEEICKLDISMSQIVSKKKILLDKYLQELENTDIPNPNYFVKDRAKQIPLIPKLHEYIIQHPTKTMFQSYEKEFIDRYVENPNNFPIYTDYIVIDEAQDVSKLFAAFIFSVIDSGRFKVILVGDDNQKIYGWRGAIDLFRVIGDVFNPIKLSLTNSFRFQKYSDIEFQTNRILKLRQNKIQGASIDEVGNQKTAYLSRTNLSLFSLALKLSKQNKDFYFDSKNFQDIEKEVEYFYELFLHTTQLFHTLRNASINTLKHLAKTKESKKILSKYEASSLIQKDGEWIILFKDFQDYIIEFKVANYLYPQFKKFKSFKSFLQIVNFAKSRRNGNLLQSLKTTMFIHSNKDQIGVNPVKAFFQMLHSHSDNKSNTALSTFHKAKGLEFSNVEIIGNLSIYKKEMCEWNTSISNSQIVLGFNTIIEPVIYKTSFDMKYELEISTSQSSPQYFTNIKDLEILEFDKYISDIREEYNMLYVAITRAQNNLNILNSKYLATLDFLDEIQGKSLKELINSEVTKIENKNPEIIQGFLYKTFFIPREILKEYLEIIG